MAVSRLLKISNKQGLHARPAAMFVKAANRYQSEIWVSKDDDVVNGKSIMGLMMLAAEFGSQVQISADGDDAEEAVAALGDLVSRGFAVDL